MDTFNIPWTVTREYIVEFKTDVDGEYTAHEQRNSLWTNPRRHWTLPIPKNPTNFAALCAFFIAQKGKWKAFSFYWDTAKDGDGNTYTVRFDQDSMTFNADEGHYLVPIVEVRTSE